MGVSSSAVNQRYNRTNSDLLPNNMKRNIHGIFCLEGDWWNDFNRASTVKPILKLLSQGVGLSVPFIHRDVGTREELVYYLRRWRQASGKRYPILYLAFHGGPNCLYVGDQRRSDAVVKLDELAEMLGSGLSGRAVHFGSCGTMKTDRRNIQRFLKATGLEAATGFKSDIEWLQSSVFDVLFFEAFLRYAITRKGVSSVNQVISTEHRHMKRALEFRMEIRDRQKR